MLLPLLMNLRMLGTSAQLDTHDGYKRPRLDFGPDETEARIAEYRQSKERLREDIRFAIDGPQRDEVREVLLEAAPQIGNAIEDFEPALQRVLADAALMREIARLALTEHQRLLDEDEDDVIALVLH